MRTSLAISTSSPSMFQRKVALSDWMIGDVLDSSSSLSSSSQPATECNCILTADMSWVSTKEKLNCRGTITQKTEGKQVERCKVCECEKRKRLLTMLCVLPLASNRGQKRPRQTDRSIYQDRKLPTFVLSEDRPVLWPFLSLLSKCNYFTTIYTKYETKQT